MYQSKLHGPESYEGYRKLHGSPGWFFKKRASRGRLFPPLLRWLFCLVSGCISFWKKIVNQTVESQIKRVMKFQSSCLETREWISGCVRSTLELPGYWTVLIRPFFSSIHQYSVYATTWTTHRFTKSSYQGIPVQLSGNPGMNIRLCQVNPEIAGVLDCADETFL